MTLPTLMEHQQIPPSNAQNQLPIAGANLSRPFVRKTVEELHNEFISSLVQDRDFHQPTISYLSKCNQVKLPILCEKCIENSTNNDEYSLNDDYQNVGEVTVKEDDESLKPVNGNYLTYLTPCGTCEYNKKLCLLYNTRRKSLAESAISSMSPINQFLNASPTPQLRAPSRGGLKSAPMKKVEILTLDENVNSLEASNEKPVKRVQIQIRPETSRLLSKRESQAIHHSATSTNSNSNSSSSNNSRTSNYSPVQQTYSAKKKKKIAPKTEENDSPMLEGDIRYKFTKSGLEIKRLNAKNSLVIDIFTPDVCKDRNEKSYAEWLNRQKDDENRKNQKFPSQIYEKQLKELLGGLKKGAMTYESWARQSYEVLILRDKIKRAKKLEEADKKERETKAKSQEVLNTYQLWKINKEFTRYRSNNTGIKK